MKNLKPRGKLIDILLNKNKVYVKSVLYDTIVGKKIKGYTPNRKWCLLTIERIVDIINMRDGLYIYVTAKSSSGIEYLYAIELKDFIYD